MGQEFLNLKPIERKRDDSGFYLIVDGQTGAGKSALIGYASLTLEKIFPGRVMVRRGLLSLEDQPDALSPKGQDVMKKLKDEGFGSKDNNPLAVFDENPERGARLIELLTEGSAAQAKIIAQDLAEGKIVIQDRSWLSANIVTNHLLFLLNQLPMDYRLKENLRARLEGCRDQEREAWQALVPDAAVLLTADPSVVAGRKPGYPQHLAQAEQEALLQLATSSPGWQWQVIENNSNESFPSDYLDLINQCSAACQERQKELRYV